MSLLLYCVAPASVGECEVQGVGGALVRTVESGGLRYFLSEAFEGTGTIETAAREVHGVIQDVFLRGPVLPFRYPTLLKDDMEMANLAEERGAAFAQFLARVGSRVQMDVRLMRTPSGGPASAANFGNTALGPGTASNAGREYLAERGRWKALLDGASERCRNLAEASAWRAEERAGGMVCHALIDRHEVISFQDRMRRLDLPEGVEAVVSGPWPPAGFWEEQSH